MIEEKPPITTVTQKFVGEDGHPLTLTNIAIIVLIVAISAPLLLVVGHALPRVSGKWFSVEIETYSSITLARSCFIWSRTFFYPPKLLEQPAIQALMVKSILAYLSLFYTRKDSFMMEVPCKSGKLQVTGDGILQLLPPFKKQPTWQVPSDQIKRFTTQPVGLGLTVLIHTTQGVYTLETVSKSNFEKIHSCFPAAQVQTCERAVYWYQDITKRAHATTYTNQKQMQKEVEKSAQYGWMPQTSAGIGSHINVGRTVTAAALTGGFSLLLGASRSKEKTTITFVRTPDWLAANA